MLKSLIGIAGAAMLTAAAPAPANAFAVRHAPDLVQDQATVQEVWHRGRPHRRIYRHRYYRAYPYRVYPGPYAYAPAPYYRPYYGPPGPVVRFGPFGFGFW
jgi:hypothetical protein